MAAAELDSLLARLRGVVFDVDGVLTDGQIIYTDDGHELKRFHVQDGASLKLLMKHDIGVAIITGRHLRLLHQQGVVANPSHEHDHTFKTRDHCAGVNAVGEQGQH